MASLYISDSLYGEFVAEYGDDAKAQMRLALEDALPGDTDD